MKQDANREMEEIIASIPAGEKPALLLHSCCGPCSSAVLERLLPHYSITLFYENPNIDTEEEYLHRLETQRELLSRLPGGDTVTLVPGTYDHEAFLDAVKGLENEPEGGRRCDVCFRLRLSRSADMARSLGIPNFTTTLSVSPHKNAALLNRIGGELQTDGLFYLPADFKKKNGYLESIRLSKEYGLYRQEYCGCEFSRWMDRPRTSDKPEEDPQIRHAGT